MSRRAVLAHGGALVGAGAAAACGPSGSGSGAAAPAAPSTGPVTLRWSTWGDEQNPFNHTAAPMGLAIFNQKYPTIKVEVEVQKDVGGVSWTQKNFSEWIAGTGPDISGHCCEHSLNWARQGLLLNLEPYVKRDTKSVPMGDYVEWLIKLFNSPEAGQFALPMYTGTVGLLYNRDIFKKKGLAFPDETWDWTKYREVAQRIAEPQNNLWARAEVGAGSMFRRFHQNGANMVDPKDDTKAAFASEKAIAAMEYEKNQIYKDGSIYQGGPKQPDATKNLGPYGEIINHRVAMWEGGSFTLTRYVQFFKDDVDWDVAPLPKGPAGRFTLATNDGWSIWKGTKNKDASWELVKFLQGDEWSDIATRIVGQQSARKSYQQKWLTGIKEANPKLADKALKWFADAIDKNYARPREFFRKEAEAYPEFTKAYNRAVRDGEEEVAAAMRAAAELVNQIHKA